MSIRLITTYEEAKALKEAGWPQTAHDALHFYDTNYEDDPRGPFQSGGRFVDNSPAYLAAPRLDELLAFLWERGYDVEWRKPFPATRSYTLTYAMKHSFGIVMSRDVDGVESSEDDVPDRLGSFVHAVLRILKVEKGTAA